MFYQIKKSVSSILGLVKITLQIFNGYCKSVVHVPKLSRNQQIFNL